MLNVALLTIAFMQPVPVEDRTEPPPSSLAGEPLRGKDWIRRHKQSRIEEQKPDFLALFAERSFEYTGGGYRHRVFKYRLFVPEVPGPTVKRPMLVWLHGHGEAGEENIRHLMHLSHLFPAPRHRKRYPYFLLAVQCPSENPTWTTNSPEADDMLNVAMAILNENVRDYPIDVDRISVSGVSSGGNACWEFAFRYPGFFSAVGPLASGGANVTRIEPFLNVPIWAFHSTDDEKTTVDGVRATVKSIKEAGGTAHLTEIPSSSHNCWGTAFEEYGLLEWLLSQKRGEKSRPLPLTVLAKGQFAAAWQKFTTGWTATLVLGQIGIPLIVLFAIWSATRRAAQKGCKHG